MRCIAGCVWGSREGGEVETDGGLFRSVYILPSEMRARANTLQGKNVSALLLSGFVGI